MSHTCISRAYLILIILVCVRYIITKPSSFNLEKLTFGQSICSSSWSKSHPFWLITKIAITRARSDPVCRHPLRHLSSPQVLSQEPWATRTDWQNCSGSRSTRPSQRRRRWSRSTRTRRSRDDLIAWISFQVFGQAQNYILLYSLPNFIWAFQYVDVYHAQLP